MLIERLVVKERKNVLLLVPKSGRKSVWEPAIRRYLAHLGGGDFSNLVVLNHTDLNREGDDLPARLERSKDKADVIIIDEAHNFRNPGPRGRAAEDAEPLPPGRSGRWQGPSRRATAGSSRSRTNKQLFLLTATPINNKLDDFRHVVQLFSREQPDYFGPDARHPLAPGALPAAREAAGAGDRDAGRRRSPGRDQSGGGQRQILAGSPIFSKLVVQRSRAYVRRSQDCRARATRSSRTGRTRRWPSTPSRRPYGRC